MIRVLMVVSIMNSGGIENYIMNVLRKIDRNKIQFDFLVHHQREGFFDKEIEALGGRIYRLPVLDDFNLIKYLRELNIFFKHHPEIQIVHGHLSSLAFFYLWFAKKNNIKWRIVHSHGAGYLKTVKGFAKNLLFRGAKTHGNIFYACSQEAGEYLFNKGKFEIMPNGVDSERFTFKRNVRTEIRNYLKINNEFVIGHVGRFNLQKNHKFILSLFNRFISEKTV